MTDLLSRFFKLALTGLMVAISCQTLQGQDAPSDPDTGSATSGNAATISQRSARTINWMRSLSGDRITSLSDAELVARLRRSLDADQEELRVLSTELETEGSPYQSCEAAFQEVDERYQVLAGELAEATDEARRVLLQEKIDDLKPIRDLARERFDLAIERRRLIGQMVPLLRALVEQAQILKAKALGEEEFSLEGAAGESPASSSEPADATAGSATDGSPSGPVPAASDELPKGENSDTDEPTEASQELESAETDVRYWESVLEILRDNIELLEARLVTVDQALQLEQGLVNNGRLTVDNAETLQALLGERLEMGSRAAESADDLQEIQLPLREAANRASQALARSRTASDRLANLTEARGLILEALTTLKKDTERARSELRRARGQVARIRNPFHPRNIYRWFLDHGPQVLAILCGMLLAYLAVRILGSKLVHVIARRGIRGSKEERLSRADTLVNSFRQFGSLVVIVGGTLMILDEAGIPIVPLLGGAAVFGLAVAFGAQNLIQDFFQGFMILLENQFKLNDIVKIGDHTGTVEQITLRTTALRGIDGTLHFIPNGQIAAVSNLTHGWSRALLDVPVAYKEDPDHVMEVILDVCRQLAPTLTLVA